MVEKSIIMTDLGSKYFFHSPNPVRQNSTICKFGQGQQDMATCPMIYIHFPGYYITEKDYKEAMNNLCPNIIKEKQ